jgi:hypothetical protein
MCSAKGHVRSAPKSGHLQRTSACPLSANSGHGPRGKASLFGSGHQHAPNFQLFAHGALESVKVAVVAFCLGPEQQHFEITFRASQERLNDRRLIRAAHFSNLVGVTRQVSNMYVAPMAVCLDSDIAIRAGLECREPLNSCFSTVLLIIAAR